MLPVVFRPRLLHLRVFCSFVVISLSDADLTSLKFLGPGEYLRISHVYPSLIVAPLDSVQGVRDLIMSIKKVPQYFGCECLSLFVYRLYS